MRRSSSASLADDLTDYVTGVFYFNGAHRTPGKALSAILRSVEELLPQCRAKAFAVSLDKRRLPRHTRPPSGNRGAPIVDPSLHEWLSELGPQHSATCLVRRRGAAQEVFNHELTASVTQAGSYGIDPDVDSPRPDAVLSFTLRASNFRQAELESPEAFNRHRKWFETLVSRIADSHCLYGFIHCFDASETSSGTLYNALRIGDVPWHHRAMELRWWARRRRGELCVPSVYWGNYFGPELCGIGDKRSSSWRSQLESILSEWDRGDQFRPLSRRYDSGGQFVALWDSPTRFSSYSRGGHYEIGAKDGRVATRVALALSDWGLLG